MKKVLFVNSEMTPYLPDSPVAVMGRELPQGIQERKNEIRSFMPRYGSINERKNQLHEVIRLSGMNIIIGDVDRPLVIKVASIAAARMQVYFIDNEDYFKRKFVYTDEKGTPFPDNGERAIFFARGVLETVKKLRWSPDIIHCHGWMSQVIPLYLKRAYKDDPIFSGAKVVLSLSGDTPEQRFSDAFHDNLIFSTVTPADIEDLKEPDGTFLAKMAIRYSDGVILSSENADPALGDFAKEIGKPVIPFDAEKVASGAYMDDYNQFYQQL